jgi:integrase
MATITKRGNRYRVQVRKFGQPPVSKTFDTKKAADAWAREIEYKLDRSQSIDIARRTTFADLLAAYREHIGRVKGMSRSKAQALDKVEKLLGRYRVAELKTATFLTFCKSREAEGAGPATILMDFSYIGTVLRHGGALVGAEHAVMEALTGLDAARRTLRHAGRVARPEERSRRPTNAELQQLLDHWEANPRQVMIPMIDITLFAIATAMRLGEIVSLEWSDLDEANRTILIRARKHPTKKATNDQRVPLLRGPCMVAGKLIDPLEIIYRQKSAWSRTGRIFPHAAQSISTNFQRTTDALKIPDLHFHDLRHDGASRLFEAGYSIEQVALVTGHKDWNMLRRYTQLRAENLHLVDTLVATGHPSTPGYNDPAYPVEGRSARTYTPD